MKLPTKVLLSLAIFLTLNHICKSLTDDFSPDYLLQAKPPHTHTPSPPLDATIFTQPFTYIGKGKQAFVFASQDGEYVIKFFKPFYANHYFSLLGHPIKIRTSKLPFFKDLYGFFHKDELARKQEQDFRSYQNALSLLAEETGVCYVHLEETKNFAQPILIHDKIGISHRIDLNKTCFLLQKKTDLLYETLLTFIKQKEDNKSKELLDSFIALAIQVQKKGVVNPTTIEANFGYKEGKALIIDVGRLLTKEDLGVIESEDSLEKATHHMHNFLQKHSPELLAYFTEKLSQEACL